jgi:Tfp pilus assembly protein PilF
MMIAQWILWSCATYQPPPPSFYIGELPPSAVAELSLDHRILVEDAWRYIQEGRAKKAEKALNELGSQNPFYYIGLGFVSLILEFPQRATQYFKASLSEFPEIVLARVGLAQIYQSSGKDDLAFDEYREILKVNPEHPWAKSQFEEIRTRKTEQLQKEASGYLTSGDLAKSKEAYLKALHYSPNATESHLALAKIYKKEGDLNKALVHFDAAASSLPQNTNVQMEYADTLFQAGELKKSLIVYEELSTKEPGNSEIQQRLETIKNRLGIFKLPSQYDSIPFSEAVSKEEIAALLSVKFKNVIDKPKGKPPIIIDISTSWASQFILHMASLGILDVYPNHTFQPKKVITRAEMAEILFRLVEHLKRKGYSFIQQIPPDRIEIADVAPGNYYYRPILLIVSYDIMDLSRERTFNPDQAVSGQEAIRLIELVLALIQ